MTHHFEVEDAKKYGLECAILLNNFRFWINKNKANKKHFYEGKYWTYNSVKAFSELFPYWSVHQIGRYLRRLEDEGLIISGNFNKAGYDQTKWYSVNDSLILQNCSIECAEMHNPFSENAQPIPDINTDINNTNVVFQKPQIDFDKLLSFFNTTTGKNIRVVNDKTKKQFNARLKEGYTKADIFNAIKNCYNDDYHQNNPKYLTLEFISRSDKLEKYSNYQNKVEVLPNDWFHRELSEGQKELLDAKQLDMWKRNKNAIEMEGGRLYPIKLIKK